MEPTRLPKFSFAASDDDKRETIGHGLCPFFSMADNASYSAAQEMFSMSKAIQAKVTESMKIEDSMSADVRVNLSVPHLLSAASFSRQLARIEVAHAGEKVGEFWSDILALATAAVLTSVAALEAYANELFVDHRSVFPEFKPKVMIKLWELCEEKTILEKYQFALLLKDAKAFDKGASPYQDVSALIKLRNGLTHFKPKWSTEPEEHAKISAVLNYKINPSPFWPTEPLFPRSWAGQSCSAWAVRSVKHFIVDFDKRADLESRLAPYMGKLTDV